ncbi:MAG: Gfo/Idh/MocA family oxidoreductase [Candidatus Hydrogenedentes bacterium]|nr:Gfo/Idh/MocA family oxidoreductase [Candidatus Hydrogenedentota bacterium]
MAKIGIMSFAHMHAYSYAASINALPEATLTAVWDDDPARGKAAAEQYGTKFIADLDSFLASDVQGVVVCSENVKHRAMVEAAAKAGKWILCEKPLATTVEDAKAMVDLCKKQGVGLGTAFPCRYITPIKAVKDDIAAGKYGKIYAAACTNNGSYPGGWFADPTWSGGGATMDHTVHVADLLRWILGKEIVKVYCENGKLIKPDIATDDVGSLHFEMEDGVKVSHIASWNRPKSFATWGDITLEFIGEKGNVSVDGFNQKLDVYSDDDMKGTWVGWGDNCDTGLVRDFAQSIDEHRDPAITGYDGLKAVEVTVAAHKSVASGKMVAV